MLPYEGNLAYFDILLLNLSELKSKSSPPIINPDDIPIKGNQQIKPNINSFPNPNSSVQNVDDIVIKPKGNFLDLLEKELSKEQKNTDNGKNEFENKPKFKYIPKSNYHDKFKVSEPTQTKKYKYYSDNFIKIIII